MNVQWSSDAFAVCHRVLELYICISPVHRTGVRLTWSSGVDFGNWALPRVSRLMFPLKKTEPQKQHQCPKKCSSLHMTTELSVYQKLMVNLAKRAPLILWSLDGWLSCMTFWCLKNGGLATSACLQLLFILQSRMILNSHVYIEIVYIFSKVKPPHACWNKEVNVCLKRDHADCCYFIRFTWLYFWTLSRPLVSTHCTFPQSVSSMFIVQVPMYADRWATEECHVWEMSFLNRTDVTSCIISVNSW